MYTIDAVKSLAILMLIFITALPMAARGATKAEFAVNADRVVGPPFVGFGAQMNPYLFCRPNDTDEKSAANLERKIIALGPQHVRIFFLNSWAEGKGDAFVSFGDPKTYASFVRTAQMAQKAGASINLTLWYDPERWKDPGDSARHFAVNVARMIEKEHLDAIRYVTIQNEPDAFRKADEPHKITLSKYVEAYRVFDDVLQEQGLRGKVQIVAGDLVKDQQVQWVKYLGPRLSGIADGYSIHVYWDYTDSAKILERLNSTREEFDGLPPDEQRPLYVTEFGTRGSKVKPEPGLYSDGQPIAEVPLQSMLNAWFMIQAVRDGYVSAVQWDMYDAEYEVQMRYGLMGEKKEGWPRKPGYFLMQLFTHTCHPGWRAVDVKGDSKDVTATGMKSDDGKLTLWAVNHGAQATEATFKNLKPNDAFHLFYWNAHGKGELADTGMIRTDNKGKISVAIPFQGVIALANVMSPIHP